MVDDDVDLHALARFLLQEVVELIFGLVGTTELQFCGTSLAKNSKDI